MPRVGQIGPIAIYIYAADHAPPHFHAINPGQEEAVIEIQTLEVLENSLSSAELRTVLAWAANNQAMLIDRWNALNPPRAR